MGVETSKYARNEDAIRCWSHAGPGTAETIGEKGMASRKQVPVTSEAKPVLAPSATPAVDSAKVATVETPSTEPTCDIGGFAVQRLRGLVHCMRPSCLVILITKL